MPKVTPHTEGSLSVKDYLPAPDSTMNSEHNKAKVDVKGNLNGLHARQDQVKTYVTGNLTSEPENGDQISSNIGEPDPPVLSAEGQNDGVQIEEATETDPSRSAMSKLAITVDNMDIAFLTGSCNFDRQDGVKEAPLKMEHAQSAVYSITTGRKPPLGRSTSTYQDEEGNKKERRMPHVPQRSYSSGSSNGVQSERETEDLLLAAIERMPPKRSDSSGSFDEDSETASSGEETTGNPYNYCNIAVLLLIFQLYFAIPGSACNQWIDKLKLKNHTNLRTILKKQPWISVIMFFLSGNTQIKNKDCFGNPFKRFLNFAKRDHLLEYQQCFPELEKTSSTPHYNINAMIRKKLKEGKCSLQEAVNWVLNGNGRPPPYSLSETPPLLLFYLYGVTEKSSQLPLTLDYKGKGGSTLKYKLAGVIFHRSGGEDHYVVRAYDPERKKWRYNTDADGGWEEDRGDPMTDTKHEFTLSAAVYIIADPPESDQSSSNNSTDIHLANNLEYLKPLA
ncbi:uncharacterized protein LOC110441457 isoform X2 [Mizuhopecten yessoensis]|uniref:uncharacterized protein LOC110441457 isoform X2 n=1 Tax=Mizuhopecten yessoensis TaxID=6573 RepID=UPI000B45D8A4|nr:uncharacterized protein LOC110441457 isoform X2 [Mizuhopecten yessoensis]